MKLRTQLLIINLTSISLLIAAVAYTYYKMVLDFKQAGLLTIVAFLAAILSSIAYWVMTIPINKSVNQLIRFAEDEDRTQLDTVHLHASTPSEFRQLTVSVNNMKDRLQHNLEQMERMEQTRRELVASVSHDLRTPIASILSFVEALNEGVVHDEETVRIYLKTIHREGHRLNGLIDDLFELSKLDAGQQLFSPSFMHIDQLILEAIESCSMRMQEKDLRMVVNIADGISAVQMMPDGISRVLNNLLDNALRYAPDHSEIQIEVSENDGCIEVQIRDEAGGISTEDRERIFDRFYRVDPSRNRSSGGAGLGLAIARSIVELHGGQIGVRTRQPQSIGSEFWFQLPTGRNVKM